MDKVDEYLRRAKELRAMTVGISGCLKEETESVAAHWERLAQERLVLLEDKLQRGELTWGETG